MSDSRSGSEARRKGSWDAGGSVGVVGSDILKTLSVGNSTKWGEEGV